MAQTTCVPLTSGVRADQADLTPNLVKQLAQEAKRPQMKSDSIGARLAAALLRDAWDHRATDVHLEPYGDGVRVRMRIDGIIADTVTLTREQAKRLGNQIRTLSSLDPIRSFVPQESRWSWSFDGHALDVRLTIAPCVNGETIAIRLLDPSRISQHIGELGLDDAHQNRVLQWLGNVSGMLLVTGPTGSGKTTTLYAMLHELRQQPRNVVTIEDPVEYKIDGITQLQVNQRHGVTFAKGLKTILRMDPDYLMLGEIRDADSARSAADASISGRVLMSTLHSRDAVGAVSALRNWGLKDLEIAVSLSVVFAQRLVRRLCSHCRQLEAPTVNDRTWLKSMRLPAPEKVWHPVGCDQCHNVGYRGRTGVFEIWRLDESSYDRILSGADERSLRAHLARQQFRTLVADGMIKAVKGITSIDELRSMGEVVPSQPEMLDALAETLTRSAA